MSPLIERYEPGSPGGNLAPTDEALAAIVAALGEILEPAGARVTEPGRPGWRPLSAHPWRFSGRWWADPAPRRRERPLR
jgi:hypothetical protein